MNWLLYSSLVVSDIRESDGDNETVYKINDQLDEESDFIIDDNEDDAKDDTKESIYPANYTNEELDIKESHMQVITL